MTLELSLTRCTYATRKVRVRVKGRLTSSHLAVKFGTTAKPNSVGRQNERDEWEKNRAWEQETLSAIDAFLNLTNYLVTLAIYTY